MSQHAGFKARYLQRLESDTAISIIQMKIKEICFQIIQNDLRTLMNYVSAYRQESFPYEQSNI